MPSRDYAVLMARYNRWQNDNLMKAASTLSPNERQEDRGAFFSSIEATFSHLLWGDTIWMSRFAGTPPPTGGIPDSTSLISDWGQFQAERVLMDETILQWAKHVDADWFDGDLRWYSGAIKSEISKPKPLLVVQLFNHQTHHRGQIHAMLTAAGARPGDTDVPFMPERYSSM